MATVKEDASAEGWLGELRSGIELDCVLELMVRFRVRVRLRVRVRVCVWVRVSVRVFRVRKAAGFT